MSLVKYEVKKKLQDVEMGEKQKMENLTVRQIQSQAVSDHRIVQ